MLLKDIITYVESLTGHVLNSDEGVLVGSPENPVQKMLVCWMASLGALERAAEIGCDSVLTHESLYYPYGAPLNTDGPADWQNWAVNRVRRSFIEKYRLNILRVHGSLDEISIFEDFRKQLQLPAPSGNDPCYYYRWHDITPCTLGELVNRVKHAVKMPNLRVSSPRGMEQIISRIGLTWGGMGLFVNVSLPAKLLDLGCDCIIAGESDDYGFRFCSEVGVPVIETSHEISENAGLERFANMLRKEFPSIGVEFYENACPWRIL